jgi:soluble lytic murein transglycosylase-like protein
MAQLQFAQLAVSTLNKGWRSPSLQALIREAGARGRRAEAARDLPREKLFQCERKGSQPFAEARATIRSLSLPSTTSMVVVVLCSLVGPPRIAHAEPTTLVEQASRSPADPYADFVGEASLRFGVPAHWIRAVMRVESVGNVDAVSPKGAMGLMQIMPDTWADLRARYHLGADPYDALDNILAGAAYLREMYDRYGSPAFLAAYNAGPTRYDEHLASGRELPAETQAYVAMLAPKIASGQADGESVASPRPLSWRQAPLFAEHAASNPTVDPPLSNVRLSRPSNTRPIVDLSALAPRSGDLFVHRASQVSSR